MERTTDLHFVVGVVEKLSAEVEESNCSFTITLEQIYSCLCVVTLNIYKMTNLIQWECGCCFLFRLIISSYPSSLLTSAEMRNFQERRDIKVCQNCDVHLSLLSL